MSLEISVQLWCAVVGPRITLLGSGFPFFEGFGSRLRLLIDVKQKQVVVHALDATANKWWQLMIDAEVVARWMQESESTVVFTGAGISTESGIPDFRSPGGVWAKYQPVYFDQFMASAAARRAYWRQKSEAHREFAHARPNRGHEVLASWESSGHVRGIVTQNIDGLHQLAGNRNVLELHGTAREIACMDCGHREPADPLVAEFLETDRVPECRECGGRLKHATVSFGQMLPMDVLDEAERWMHEAGVVLAIGSSLVVTPAADLPRVAAGSGARLAIINRDPTPLDELADLVVNEAIGHTLAAIDDALRCRS